MNDSQSCNDPSRGRLLAAYELGILAEEERKLFEDHALHCSTCIDALYELSAEMSLIRRHPRRLASALEFEGDAVAPRSESSWWRDLWILLLSAIRRLDLFRADRLVPAAAIVAILITLVLQRPTGVDWRSMSDLEPVPYVELQTRGVVDREAARRFQEGISLYQEGSYGEASRILSQAARLAESGGDRVFADQTEFFAGLSFLIDLEADSASIYLEKASASDLPVLADRATWFLAQKCLLQGNPDCALEHLEELAAGSPAYSQRAAQKIAKIRAAR